MEQTAAKAVETKAIADANREMVASKKTGERICPKCGEINPVSRVTCQKCHEKIFSPGSKTKQAKSVKTQKVSKADRKRIEKREKGKAKEKGKPAPKKSVPKKEGKFFHLRQALGSGKEWTPESLMKASGFDAQNLRVALSILRNPRRTPKDRMIDTEFDKDKGKILLRK